MKLNSKQFNSIYIFCILHYGIVNSDEIYRLILRYDHTFKKKDLIQDLTKRLGKRNSLYFMGVTKNKVFFLFDNRYKKAPDLIAEYENLRDHATNSYYLPDFFEDLLVYTPKNIEKHKLVFDKNHLALIQAYFDEHLTFKKLERMREEAGNFAVDLLLKHIRRLSFNPHPFNFDLFFSDLTSYVYMSIGQFEFRSLVEEINALLNTVRFPAYNGYTAKELSKVNELILVKVHDESSFLLALEDALRKYSNYYDLFFEYCFGMLFVSPYTRRKIDELLEKYRPSYNIEIKD